MANSKWERRDFLKAAACGALSAPVLTSLNSLGLAQTQSPAETRKAATHTGPTVTLNVRDYGAIGDGKATDTLALQQTIDRCAVLGGGVVMIPVGEYFTGALVCCAAM